MGVVAGHRPTAAARAVQVAVPRPLRQTFDYAVPATCPVPAPGSRVRVPLGPTRTVGVVLGPAETSRPGLKPIDEVLDPAPLLPADLLALARWLAGYYHHPIGRVLAAMLPALARRGAQAPAQQETVWQALPGAAAALRRAPQQRLALERLARAGGIADGDLATAGIPRRVLTALRRKRLVTGRHALRLEALAPCEPAEPGFEPTPAQRAAAAAVVASLGRHRCHLLDGVTGSGKTEVYLRIIAEVLRRGGQALVLVPEIALTPQTLARFRERFGTAAVLHSGASDRQRFDTWTKCARGVHRVLVGTRSAVFAPFARLAAIVVDEEHDSSFKQQDGLPYSARDVAVKRASLLRVPVVLGSATPSLESLENVRRGRYARARLDERAGGAALPVYRVLDIRGERLDRGFAPALHRAIARHLAAGSQVLAFINRRGYAPTLLCAKCGWQARCDHCDARLTCHRSAGRVCHRLRCHHCGHQRLAPAACPACGAEELQPVGAGTQRVEEALAERHPGVPLLRIDGDTARDAGRLAADLAVVASGVPALLVGTQMLAKGHHFPNVTMVAVLNADAGFLSPDFRAPERTAQLVVQVAGRAGRAKRPGEVWVQTFDPAGAHLSALIGGGYLGFAEQEREQRAAAGMPPFSALAMVRAESRRGDAAQTLLVQAAATLAAEEAVEVLGPAPAPLARRADLVRWQVLALAVRRASLHRALTRLEDAEPKAPGVRWTIDVDPLDTF